MNSPESIPDPPDKKDIPRKRSKVSRACDSCRRKKIRCDAEYLTTLLKVTKVCNNCSKTGDVCTFSRTPLKRGPSRGYIRDLADRMDDPYTPQHPVGHHTLIIKLNRPRSKLVDAPGPKPSANSTATPPLPMLQALMKPMLHRLAFVPQSGASLPIILPPLLGPQPLTQPVKLSVSVPKGSAPISPNGAALTKLPMPERDTRIQGPLWKVPYEMPTLGGVGLTVSSPGNVSGINSRRSSVDSVSSILTTGSRLRLPSLKLLVLVNLDLLASDLDDDYYSVRLRAYSASLLPRNSVSSVLSSLNGRMNTQLLLNGPPHPAPSPGAFYFPSQMVTLNQPQIHVQSTGTEVSLVPLNPVDQNLRIYYEKFHTNFPILPMNDQLILRLVSVLQSEPGPTLQIVQLFSTALNNLIHYPFVPLDTLINLLRNFLSLYPFNHHGLAAKDDLLVLLFLALVLINYTILINGDVYSLGISMAASVFNDFKIMENYADLCKSGNSSLSSDDIQILLPRLYFCLSIIDNCHSLSFGCQPQMPGSFDMLRQTASRLFPPHSVSSLFYCNIQAASVLNELVKLRSHVIFSTSTVLRFNPSWAVQPVSPTSYSPTLNFALFFVNLIKDKYELYDYLIETCNHLKSVSHNRGTSEDEIYENFYDYQFKSSRLIKKLSQSILNFANYVSTIYSQMKSASATVRYDLINPYFNMSYGQSLKLIKACKLLIDSLLGHVCDNEIITRAVKINNDLSIAFNLLMSNLNNNLNALTNTRNAFGNQAKSNGNTTPQSALETHEATGLGSTCISLIYNKLELYKLDFSTLPSSPEESSMGKKRKNLELWKQEFMNTITSFVSREDIDGWY